MSNKTVPFIQLIDVHSGYYGKEVLRGISFFINEPAVYVVLGPNGAGKTTPFRTIAEILGTLKGKIEIDCQPTKHGKCSQAGLFEPHRKHSGSDDCQGGAVFLCRN